MSLIDQSLGEAFEDADVARSYAARPPYPPALYEMLFGLTTRRRRAVDLGCGPGKIARVLAGQFNRVEAIDPSMAMIAAGKQQDAGAHPNIEWQALTAEAAPLPGPYDLVTAGASIHWMRHDIIFPRLASAMHPDGVLAIISGDDVSSAVWAHEWVAFTAEWLQKLGRVPDPQGYNTALHAYEDWMDITGSASFLFPFAQSLDDFIACQHSRASWARAEMGDHLAQAFDDELRTLLRPYTIGGKLRYEVGSTLIWGRPRTHRR
jgi:SAM-dependent methyltransferase